MPQFSHQSLQCVRARVCVCVNAFQFEGTLQRFYSNNTSDPLLHIPLKWS